MGARLTALALLTPALAPLLAKENTMARFVCSTPPRAQFAFGGPIGTRLEANLRHWLLIAPKANPGMVEMLRRKDARVRYTPSPHRSHPNPGVVDFAGEFVGKYLISAIQGRRTTDDPDLEPTIRRVVRELIAVQAEDGYLGPFPKGERLLGHWDLWGHYHWMLALMIWHQETGDEEAYAAVLRAADLVCNLYLDTGRRVLQAGAHEMNMAIIHVLARLYRESGEARYLRMTRAIEKDWEESGDYFRAGLAGRPFFRTPRPRWESLHGLQGMVELYRITGDDAYRRAFLNLWRSIRNLDRHHDGSFSTGEGAIGTPYASGAIETCCTVAWIAISIDALRLTGDSRIADELERSTLNAIPAAQHPSGRWWTYDTPMDGVRRAFHDHVNWQCRPGAPELGCCPVNGPRGLGMLSEWAVMLDEGGPLVNYYGPGTTALTLLDGRPLSLRQETTYPVGATVALIVDSAEPMELDLRLRIPAWSRQSQVAVNGEQVEWVEAGRYLSVRRGWSPGDRVVLTLDMGLRTEPGGGQRKGKTSLFRGPLLLTYDHHYNRQDRAGPPTLDPGKLGARLLPLPDETLPPWILVEVGSGEEREVLCDFASAGAYGTAYWSWLPAVDLAPGPFYLGSPVEGQRVAPGPVLLEWGGVRRAQPARLEQVLTVSRHPDGHDPLLQTATEFAYHVVDLEPGTHYWQVARRSEHGERTNEYAFHSFVVDPGVAPAPLDLPPQLTVDDNGVVVASPLDGDGTPTSGELLVSRSITPAEDRRGNSSGALAFNGRDSKLSYRLAYFPEGDYSALCWFYLESYPKERYEQIVSAWCPGEDPLRITVEGEELFARIEGHGTGGTPRVPVGLQRWTHVAAVKEEGKLALYVDGVSAGSTAAPAVVLSRSTEIALGANPLFTGHEYFHGRIDDFRFFARALSPEEVRKAFEAGDE